MVNYKDIDPNSTKWYILSCKVAREFCPPIYPCKKCNYPVIQGYCCENCGDNNPSEDY